jgi:hypothetical protein
VRYGEKQPEGLKKREYEDLRGKLCPLRQKNRGENKKTGKTD